MIPANCHRWSMLSLYPDIPVEVYTIRANASDGAALWWQSGEHPGYSRQRGQEMFRRGDHPDEHRHLLRLRQV
jgi:hypothetical protein